MEDETKPPFHGKTPEDVRVDSSIGGISVRSIIVSVVVLTVCIMSSLKLKVEEPLYTLVGLTVGYYFGQSNSKASVRK